jgi:hypothetical protein
VSVREALPPCGEEGVGPFAGMFCVAPWGHDRGHVYAEPGDDPIRRLEEQLRVTEDERDSWARVARQYESALADRGLL